MIKKKLKAGIIGLGVGESHILGYDTHSECEVVALCDFSSKKYSDAVKKYPNYKVTKNPDDILENDDIDIVSIASFDNYHYPQVVKALLNDKHVFVEKPICLYQHELRHIREVLSSKPDLQISSNLILRKCPRFQNLKHRLDNGEYGEIYYAEGDYNYGRLEKITKGWRGQIEFYSIVYGGAIHMVDLLLWLTGKRVKQVSAVGTKISTRNTAFRYNDMVVALLEMEEGGVMKIAANFGCVAPHFHAVRLYGTEKTFENGRDTAIEYESRDTLDAPTINRDPYPGYHKSDLIHSFVDSIVGRGTADVKTEDVFSVMSVCLAIEKAVSESDGKTVAVEYI